MLKLATLVLLTLVGTTLVDQARPIPVESNPGIGLIKIKVPKALEASASASNQIADTFKTPVVKAVSVASGGSKEQWMTQAGIPQSDWQCADSLITKESGWRVNAQNPSSPAYGIPQSLPGEKMASAGQDWRTNPVTQLIWMKGYVADVYGGFCGAWAHSQSVNWY